MFWAVVGTFKRLQAALSKKKKNYFLGVCGHSQQLYATRAIVYTAARAGNFNNLHNIERT